MIHHSCPACHARLSYRDELAGCPVLCKECQFAFDLPGDAPAPAAPSVPLPDLSLPARRPRPSRWATFARVAVPLALLACFVGWVYATVQRRLRKEPEPPTATVFMDNHTDRPVTVEVDGQPWQWLNARTSFDEKLAPGGYRIVVRGEDGSVVQDHRVAVFANGRYILNVAGQQRYRREVVLYTNSGAPTVPRTPEEMPKVVADGWMDVTRIDYLFDEAPKRIIVGDVELSRITKKQRLERIVD